MSLGNPLDRPLHPARGDLEQTDRAVHELGGGAVAVGTEGETAALPEGDTARGEIATAQIPDAILLGPVRPLILDPQVAAVGAEPQPRGGVAEAGQTEDLAVIGHATDEDFTL